MAADRWEPPAGEVAELIRTAIAGLLSQSERLFAEVDAAVLAVQPALPAPDQQLAEAIRASTRSNLAHWATAMIAEPGARVTPNIVPETVELAREIVRRGIDDAGLAGYRVGQNTAWQAFMDTAFTLTDDPARLHAMLAVTHRSAATFVDDMLAALRAEMERERELLSSSVRSERLEAVRLVLDGAPISPAAASRRLRYELDAPHLAAVIWSDSVGPRDAQALAAAAERLGSALGTAHTGRTLTAMPVPSTLWAWLALSGGADASAIERGVPRMSPVSDIRVAIGRPGRGVEGFRSSHAEALQTQRMMRLVPAGAELAAVAVATFDDVQVAALAAGDRERAAAFVRETLGSLPSADPALLETVRAYIAADCNVSGAARALFAHRNTVLGRLRRAEELLGVPLRGRAVRIGLALELSRWLGRSAVGG